MLPLSTYSTLDPKIKKIFDEISLRAVNGRIEPFVVDENNRMVGILTSSPRYSLDVNGSMGVSGPALFEEINVLDLKAQSLGVSQHLIAGTLSTGRIISPELNWQVYKPTYTGFSVNPATAMSRYLKIGQLVIYQHDSVSAPGTSNATSFTISLPFGYHGGGIISYPINFFNNSAQSVTPGMIESTSTLVGTLYTDWAGALWTGSGTKGARFTMIYQTND